MVGSGGGKIPKIRLMSRKKSVRYPSGVCKTDSRRISDLRNMEYGIKLTEENKKGNTACKTYGVVFSEEYKASNIKASGTPGHLFHLRPHRSYMRLSREEGVESKLADR